MGEGWKVAKVLEYGSRGSERPEERISPEEGKFIRYHLVQEHPVLRRSSNQAIPPPEEPSIGNLTYKSTSKTATALVSATPPTLAAVTDPKVRIHPIKSTWLLEIHEVGALPSSSSVLHASSISTPLD